MQENGQIIFDNPQWYGGGCRDGMAGVAAILGRGGPQWYCAAAPIRFRLHAPCMAQRPHWAFGAAPLDAMGCRHTYWGRKVLRLNNF